MKSKNKYSQTFIDLLVTMHKLRRQAIVNPVYATNFNDGKFNRDSTGSETYRIPQPIVITDNNLWEKCSRTEWYLIGRISKELKQYNCLWHCAESVKSSSSSRLAIKGLIKKEILIKTETTDIYVVNPLHIRKGDLFVVIATTLRMLEDESRVGIEHIANKKPVKNYDISTPSIGYGYVTGDADIISN